ncbi:MAG: hypothetical protein AMXMBFR64_61300 [Myxococcales bacterium]
MCGPDGCGGSCGGCGGAEACDGLACAPVGGPCGALPPTGVCNGVVLSLCVDGALAAVDCGSASLLCDWNPEASTHDCVVTACAPTCTGRECGDDGCGGACGGCEPGVGCDGASGLCGETGCGDLTEAGRCQGNTLHFCDGARRRSQDCTAVERRCAWDSDANDGLGRWGCVR